MLLSAVRDFAQGFSRGLGLFFTERQNLTEKTVASQASAARKARSALRPDRA